MPDVTLDNLHLIPWFIVPGLVILFVRSQFVAGQSSSHSTTFLNYLVVSLIYYALVLLFLSVWGMDYGKALAWFALILVGPTALGLLLGLNIQKNLFHRILQRCGLNPVHVVPTAWDWKFGNMAEQWVLVTLKDGTRFSGFCGTGSFASSDPTERDIYIQLIYDVDDDNRWRSPGEKGVLIAAGEVRTIEFWPYNPEENISEQGK